MTMYHTVHVPHHTLVVRMEHGFFAALNVKSHRGKLHHNTLVQLNYMKRSHDKSHDQMELILDACTWWLGWLITRGVPFWKLLLPRLQATPSQVTQIQLLRHINYHIYMCDHVRIPVI